MIFANEIHEKKNPLDFIPQRFLGLTSYILEKWYEIHSDHFLCQRMLLISEFASDWKILFYVIG